MSNTKSMDMGREKLREDGEDTCMCQAYYGSQTLETKRIPKRTTLGEKSPKDPYSGLLSCRGWTWMNIVDLIKALPRIHGFEP
jgi:hypothetical protein